MQMKRHYLLIFAFILFAVSSFSQKTVSGTITAADGETLIGANVIRLQISMATIH